jgi:hypothetical protein
MPSAPLLGAAMTARRRQWVATAPGVAGATGPPQPGTRQARAIRVVAPKAALLTKLVIWVRIIWNVGMAVSPQVGFLRLRANMRPARRAG